MGMGELLWKDRLVVKLFLRGYKVMAMVADLAGKAREHEIASSF